MLPLHGLLSKGRTILKIYLSDKKFRNSFDRLPSSSGLKGRRWDKKFKTRIKPVSIETNCFSPFQLQNTDSALISILKVISAPLTVYQIRFLIPKNLAEEENPSEAVLETIKKSISNPNPSHLYRLPTPQAPVRPAPVPNTARLSAGKFEMPLRNASCSNVTITGMGCLKNDRRF